jgi:hypothetical protein
MPHEDGNYELEPTERAKHGRWIVGLSVGEGGLSADAIMRPHPKGDYVQYDDYIVSEMMLVEAESHIDAAEKRIKKLEMALQLIATNTIPQGMPPSMFADRVLAPQASDAGESK